MALYKNILFPILKRTDPELAHEGALRWMELGQESAVGRAALRTAAGRVPFAPTKVAGITFPNVLGIAAGFDKDVRVAAALGELGFGHVETGTLTPRPQPGNPKPRIFRLPDHRALINRMGFPNCGVDAALPRLRALARTRRHLVIGVSLGKQKETPLEEAAGDYEAVMQKVARYCDYLAVNISSPNTPGLRELQGTQYLRDLCNALQQRNRELAEEAGHPRRPLFVKIAPDLRRTELEQMLDVFIETKIDGIIATNTTLSRHGIAKDAAREEGGLSGLPLRRKSNIIIEHIANYTEGRMPIIGAGGILSARHVAEKLEAGASLVQVYTGFIYEGPGMAGRVLSGMENLQR